MIEEGHVASDALANKLGFLRYGRHEKPEDGEKKDRKKRRTAS